MIPVGFPLADLISTGDLPAVPAAADACLSNAVNLMLLVCVVLYVQDAAVGPTLFFYSLLKPSKSTTLQTNDTLSSKHPSLPPSLFPASLFPTASFSSAPPVRKATLPASIFLRPTRRWARRRHWPAVRQQSLSWHDADRCC